MQDSNAAHRSQRDYATRSHFTKYCRGNYAASFAGCDVPNLASSLVFVYVH